MILPIPCNWTAAAGSGQEKWGIPTETPADLFFLEFVDRLWLKVMGDGHEKRGGSLYGLLHPRTKAVVRMGLMVTMIGRCPLFAGGPFSRNSWRFSASYCIVLLVLRFSILGRQREMMDLPTGLMGMFGESCARAGVDRGGAGEPLCAAGSPRFTSAPLYY